MCANSPPTGCSAALDKWEHSSRACLTSRAALGAGAWSGDVGAMGKFSLVLGPLMARAALSYSRAASSAVSKVPNQRRTFLVVSRISAAYLPQGLRRTPRYLQHGTAKCCPCTSGRRGDKAASGVKFSSQAGDWCSCVLVKRH